MGDVRSKREEGRSKKSDVRRMMEEGRVLNALMC